MKLIIIFLLTLVCSNQIYAQSILITHYDPFGSKKANNSEKIAKLVIKELRQKNIQVKLCKLRTVYDKAYDEVLDCINSMPTRPTHLISLGEGPCVGIKIETRAVNLKNGMSDNDGVQYSGQLIYPNENDSLGVTLPVQKAFCALPPKQRKKVYISQDAGTFVCNNVLYHSLRNLNIPSAFIHVPQTACMRRGSNSNKSLSVIIRNMIISMAKEMPPYSTQPATKQEVIQKLEQPLSPCERMFYNILKDEY